MTELTEPLYRNKIMTNATCSFQHKHCWIEYLIPIARNDEDQFYLDNFSVNGFSFLHVIMILYIVGESSLYAKNESYSRALLQWGRAAGQGMSFGMQRLFVLPSSQRAALTLRRVVCS